MAIESAPVFDSTIEGSDPATSKQGLSNPVAVPAEVVPIPTFPAESIVIAGDKEELELVEKLNSPAVALTGLADIRASGMVVLPLTL